MFHYFPDIIDKLGKLPDIRKNPQYIISEIIFAAIAMNIFKSGTRNAFNNFRSELNFGKNYFKAFGLRLPHMDTVNAVLAIIENRELERLKYHMVSTLIEKKLFYNFRICSQYYNIAFDGTGVMTINETNVKKFPGALTTTSKNGAVTYFIKVLEAKLITRNGFAISLGTEWIENEGEYDKQDCEMKAFKRLAEKIKQEFPRLPICAVADGLYPNQTFFDICKNNEWGFIVTFKDGNLATVWKDIAGIKKIQSEEDRRKTVATVKKRVKGDDGKEKIIPVEIKLSYSWINNLEYGGHLLNYLEMTELEEGKVIHRFSYISNLKIDYQNVIEIAENGRIRFTIENQGFNTQKNLGYGMTHKFSRTSMNAVKNYYTCVQIGHIINQLFELRQEVKSLIIGRQTMQGLWRFIVSHFCFEDLSDTFDEQFGRKRERVRLVV